ncbi:MAG: dihydroorotate dehydrogenase [Candidatus Omnitrophica bacterium]|nr:dihydroorotate dehydrogenase [Candidatus Omnitrophota bacterium]
MDLKTKIGGVIFKNPIWTASGTFGTGEEFRDFLNLDEIGAIVTKTVTLKAREGNAPPRIVETASGLLNSIGLENKGIGAFKKEDYSCLKKLQTKVIISIAGETKEEFEKCAALVADKNFPHAIELNLSCPNVIHPEAKHSLIAQDASLTEEMVKIVKKSAKCPVIAKLAPNVTDIAEIARGAENGGADAVSLVNTYMGLAVDVQSMKPVLGNRVGGLSGPAIKPLALKAVWDVYGKVKIPIIGIGGIMTGLDAVEFMLAGASAVEIGTANFTDPVIYKTILKEFKEYLKRKNIKSAKELVGKLR